MLQLLNIFFHAIHLTVILINLTFWMSFKTLRAAQITLVLTLLSWIGFGFKYGFGYCFLTDWHWQIKGEMGEEQLPPSYITYIIDRIFGFNPPEELIYQATIAAISIATLGCLIQSIRALTRKT